MNCKNCNTEVSQNFCPNCGQPIKVRRIDRHYITHEIEHVLHFERGILYTLKALLTSPGQNIKYFINENRYRLVRPIVFIVVTSLIYTIAIHFFHIEDGYVNFEDANWPTTSLIFAWIRGHYGYANIIIGVFIAIWIRLFFRKYDFNFFEILILLCFVMGMGMLIFSVFAIFQGLTHHNLVQVGGVVVMIYCAWAIGQFFDRAKGWNYVKGCISYILGLLSFSLSVFLIGALIDLTIKH